MLPNAPLLFISILIAAHFAMPSRACARRVRPPFEPTDLQLENRGLLELDLQFGAIQSRDPARIVVPDFELDLGLRHDLELDVDGTYAIEGPSNGAFGFDRSAPDNLWLSAKWCFYDAGNLEEHTGFALGVQLGPKLPLARGAHGAGVESLLLIGTTLGRTHLVWNAGGFVDPAVSTTGRPTGIELGVDVDVDLDRHDTFSFDAGVSGVLFFSDDPQQLITAAGVTWSALEHLDLSITGLLGIAGPDRYGVLLGVAPKLRLFE
jgi:hypothetical protein